MLLSQLKTWWLEFTSDWGRPLGVALAIVMLLSLAILPSDVSYILTRALLPIFWIIAIRMTRRMKERPSSGRRRNGRAAEQSVRKIARKHANLFRLTLLLLLVLVAALILGLIGSINEGQDWVSSAGWATGAGLTMALFIAYVRPRFEL